MAYRILADALLVVHLAFIAFVIAGGWLVLRWPRLAWLHLPAALWGAFVEFSGTLCPLTPWELSLRAQAGQAGWQGGFIEHYLLPVVYPEGLTASAQWTLGGLVVAINAIIYALAIRGRMRSKGAARAR